MTAIERHTAALAAELRKWKARAEKAEQERDEMQAELRELLKATKPMTTVDEDGRVWRVEMATDEREQETNPEGDECES